MFAAIALNQSLNFLKFNSFQEKFSAIILIIIFYSAKFFASYAWKKIIFLLMHILV